MKKILSSILCLVAVIASVCAFSSCDFVTDQVDYITGAKEPRLEGKTPYEVYSSSMSQIITSSGYKQSLRIKITGSISDEDVNSSMLVESAKDGKNESLIMSSVDSEGLEAVSMAIWYVDGILYYAIPPLDFKFKRELSYEDYAVYSSENGLTADLTALYDGMFNEMPEGWFDGRGFTKNENGGYYIDLDVDTREFAETISGSDVEDEDVENMEASVRIYVTADGKLKEIFMSFTQTEDGDEVITEIIYKVSNMGTATVKAPETDESWAEAVDPQ